MKVNRNRIMGAALAALMAGSGAHAAQILKTDDMTLNLDGRFKMMGELEYVEADPVRDLTRIYLFNTQDRLMINGDYDKTKFFFETAFGGEADNTSNNQINLLEYYAEAPLTDGGGLNYFAGQFKVPANRDSADDTGHVFFTEKSMLTQMFFNTGYDTGIGLHGKAGNFDGLLGTISGAPDLPQRYLPEIFNLPPMLFVRLGYDGIGEDPFHPRQGLGQGTGMGLASVYGIVMQSHASIRVESQPGFGSQFDVYFPMIDSPLKGPEIPAHSGRLSKGREKILLVEDEPALRHTLAQALGDQGYEVLEASHGAEALDLMKNLKVPVDAMVSDLIMPGMDGLKLAKQMRQQYGLKRVLVMSGYSYPVVSTLEGDLPQENILQKPMSLAKLLGRLREILDRPD
jgi:CheY-like chemotaxis protein